MHEKITALYCRYSHDDGQEAENASITHQKALLKEYAENNGFTNLRCYVDDGYTGTNFNRPDFQRMMEDVEKGIIKTILVKDMSRFGRNYILVGQYVELVLPQHNVRVIGVTDNGAILKKWTAKSERWYNNKKRRETHGKHQVYRGIQAKHSKLV